MASVPATQFESIRGSFAGIGIRQFGAPVLRQVAKPLVLPRDQVLASEIIGCLEETMKAARRLHTFSRGLGLAAPQIGFSRRIAIVHPQGELPIRMVNPRVVALSSETAPGFEGCLSFFDYRGEVRRPVDATIEYEDAHGTATARRLEGDAARLALHEIDHLDGRLYTDLMAPGAELIEANEEYP
jgi:peptide deformylase